MELSSNSKSLYLNKITYVNLRWIGIIGQFITINSVAEKEYEECLVKIQPILDIIDDK